MQTHSASVTRTNTKVMRLRHLIMSFNSLVHLSKSIALSIRFSLPYTGGVLKSTIDNMNKIKNENVLNHFISGDLWKSKISTFTDQQIMIPYHLYCDKTQLNNALGYHCSSGLESCVYYSLPTIPVQYASRLDNIFVAMLSSAADTKEFGPDTCFEPLINKLNNLALDGVEMTVDGRKVTVTSFLGFFWATTWH